MPPCGHVTAIPHDSYSYFYYYSYYYYYYSYYQYYNNYYWDVCLSPFPSVLLAPPLRPSFLAHCLSLEGHKHMEWLQYAPHRTT